MYTIDNRTDSNSIEWESKVLAMPNIPRGNGYPISLKIILNALKEQKPNESIINIEGSERKDSLDEICIRLRPLNIVSGSAKTKWIISDDALKWLDTEDALLLAKILNAKIKFFSEILQILSKGKCKVQEILQIAINKYEIPWKTKQETIARLNWLRDLNLAEYEDYSHNYIITELGKNFLIEVGYINYNSIEKGIDQTLSESEINMSNWALDLVEMSKDDERKDGIGYFPGSVNAMHETLMEYLILMDGPTQKQDIIKYSKEKYGVKDSSVRSFLTPV